MAAHSGSIIIQAAANGPVDYQIVSKSTVTKTFLYISNVGNNPGLIGLATPACIQCNPGDPPLVWRTSNPDGTGVPQDYVTGWSLLGTTFAIMTVYSEDWQGK